MTSRVVLPSRSEMSTTTLPSEEALQSSRSFVMRADVELLNWFMRDRSAVLWKAGLRNNRRSLCSLELTRENRLLPKNRDPQKLAKYCGKIISLIFNECP